ncbi:P-loop containing nucleoside triphosphate hydrolase protein [Madurella fahalii]|uniref:P-loop containing nucleoside triphosphate hydrolase protein n=1 Tax=Madurella fahalii TaxID=1157608 RepID=A0ABQ0GFX7_9PEZI
MEPRTQSQPSLDGLGNHVYLEKQDRLRDIGIDIHTSQIVVVGGQSSGKSSLLESLTGFSFPRGQGLCTRYATQITLRRSQITNTAISITPGPHSNSDRKEQLRAFRYDARGFQGERLANIIDEAGEVMGIRSNRGPGKSNRPMFSSDILKIEISGPARQEPHLTVIDVPGLFQVTEEGTYSTTDFAHYLTGAVGRTTETDKMMIEALVRNYMENERTIILVVMSCLADRATEGILQLAKAADPKGIRTVGVLTKADLVRERAVFQTLLDLVRGDTLRLGYFVVSNRGADEDRLSLVQCKEKEKKLFQQQNWAAIAGLRRAGVDALRDELQRLLMDLAKQELPKQRAEVAKRLYECRISLDEMGPPRDGPASQREYLTRLASKFERAAHDALEGRYQANPVFDHDPGLKLITRVVHLNDGFSSLMSKKGHTRKFQGDSPSSSESKAVARYETMAAQLYATLEEYPELIDIVPVQGLECTGPSDDSIMEHIAASYNENRGPELGTFSGSLLATAFKDQAKMWASIVYGHLGVITIAVHNFVRKLLEFVVDDPRVLGEIWETLILEQLLSQYKRAKRHAAFVIDVEMNSIPMTVNSQFNSNLRKSRAERLLEGMQTIATGYDNMSISIKTEEVVRLTTSKANADQVREDIHDILKSYYKVSLKRFVDTICRQVVDYFLLSGAGNPLQIIDPGVITQLSDAQLDRIAGEDGVTRRDRQRLENDIQGLEAAMVVLRG